MDKGEAVRALDMLRTTRGALAERARWSLARHAAFGLVSGGLIAGYALPGPWPVVVAVTCLAVTALVVARDRRRDGFFVNGYRPGRTRWVTAAMVVVVTGALAGAVMAKARYGLTWAPVAIGGGVAMIGTIGSIAWQRVYRRELRPRHER